MAKQRGDEAEAKESLDAMTFIGSFEQAQHSEFFSELAGFYAHVDSDKIQRLLQAQDTLASGHNLVRSDYAKAISEFERSRDLFAQTRDV